MPDSSENITAPATVYLQLSDTGTIRKWSHEPFAGGVEYRRVDAPRFSAGRCQQFGTALPCFDCMSRNKHLCPPPIAQAFSANGAKP